MKELSIEEKAKRYDEAKLRMRAAYNSNRCTIGFMNEIFPELQESKDKKIREDMIDYFKSLLVQSSKEEFNDFINNKFKRYIAWLEKQGERNPTDKVGNYNHKEVLQAIINEQKPVWSEDDDNCLSTIIAEFSKCAGRTVSKDEWMRCNDFLNSLKNRIQPKQEWSEDDEKEIAVLEAYIRSKDWNERHIDRALGIVDELVNKIKSSNLI